MVRGFRWEEKYPAKKEVGGRRLTKGDSGVFSFVHSNIVMHCLTMGIRSEKCVIRRLSRCVTIRVYLLTQVGGIAYYTLKLYVTNLMELLPYMWSVVDRNVVMQRMTVLVHLSLTNIY